MGDAESTPPTTSGPLLQALAAHRDGLTAYVERRLPSVLRGSVDPGDVVQDVSCEAIRYESTFVALDESSGRRWLYTVARRRLTVLLERHMRWGTVEAVDPLVPMLEELARYERTPSLSAMSRETWAAVLGSLDRLPAQYSHVIRARYMDLRPAAEVAVMIGRSVRSVEQLLVRAMAALRVELRSLIVAHA